MKQYCVIIQVTMAALCHPGGNHGDLFSWQQPAISLGTCHLALLYLPGSTKSRGRCIHNMAEMGWQVGCPYTVVSKGEQSSWSGPTQLCPLPDKERLSLWSHRSWYILLYVGWQVGSPPYSSKQKVDSSHGQRGTGKCLC